MGTKYKDFLVYQIGGQPSAIDKAIGMINRTQSVWRLRWAEDKIEKPSNRDPSVHFSLLAREERKVGVCESRFMIGVTEGLVDANNLLSLFDSDSATALITEYEWKAQRSYDLPEIFWALALTNVCFRANVNDSCQQTNCIGYKKHHIDRLLLRVLDIHICDECMNHVSAKYKYQVSDLRNLVYMLKRPREYESSPIPTIEPLPVLESQLKRQLKLGRTDTFARCGIVLVMHFLTDLVPFIEGLKRLGAEEKSIALLVKPYPYAQRTLVHSIFCQQYPRIRLEYVDKLPPGDDLLAELTAHCQSTSGGKILVIEDGGYVVPFLHRRYSREKDFCIGAVEQTTKGLREDEKIEPAEIHFPILNVAKSKFKEEYESPLVGRAAVASIQRLLPDESLSGKKALVIGFGSIGREVANALRGIGMIVLVCDLDAEAVASARVRGFEAETSSLKLVKEASLVVGTTGRLGIGKELIDNMKGKTIIASTSSDQVEIDTGYLGQLAKYSRYEQGLGTYYEVGSGSSQRTIILLADGFPINFYSGSGIPNKAIDPILAQLFIAAIHIAREHKQLQRGILPIMDDLADKYGLLADFLATYSR